PVPKNRTSLFPCICKLLVAVEFFDGIHHSNDIRDRSICLDIMNRVAYISAVFGEDLQSLKNLLANFFRCSERKYLLCINTAAPEYDVFSVGVVQFLRIHSLCSALYRVDSVNSSLNQIRKNREDTAAGMFQSLPCGIGVYPVGHLLVVGQIELFEYFRIHEGTSLCTEVGTAQEQDIDV